MGDTLEHDVMLRNVLTHVVPRGGEGIMYVTLEHDAVYSHMQSRGGGHNGSYFRARRNVLHMQSRGECKKL